MNNCPICEEELSFDAEGYELTSGGVLLCLNRHCDVGDPSSYKIKGKGLFGLKKPLALSAKGWTNWDELAKKQHPIRYWFSEEFSSSVSSAKIRWISEPMNQIRYRTYNRYHRINTGLPPGYNDSSEVLMHSSFNILVDFVEIEKAYCMLWDDTATDTRKWWQKGPLNNWRDPALGLAHLRWEMGLKQGESFHLKEGDPKYNEPTRQAEGAKEIYELYLWWVGIRPSRGDAMDVSGLGDWYESSRVKGQGIMAMMAESEKNRLEEGSTYKDLHKAHTEIEEGYEAEDEAMLIRLMKIRQSLWS